MGLLRKKKDDANTANLPEGTLEKAFYFAANGQTINMTLEEIRETLALHWIAHPIHPIQAIKGLTLVIT